ncbi:hypothetical protein [Streptomyces flavalbus]|uniref:Uncharacterized protein n=1 Tax=Streptomyces flavalbus TaxID=2665155 RepID=A0ABW2W5X0_9ACTN
MLRRITPRALLVPGSVIALLIVVVGLGPDLLEARDSVPVWYLVLTGVFLCRPFFYPVVFKEQYLVAAEKCEKVKPSPLLSRCAFLLAAVGGAALLMPQPSVPAFWVAVGVAAVHCVASPVVWPFAVWRSGITSKAR